MNAQERAALDRHITGNWGEDSVPDDDLPELAPGMWAWWTSPPELLYGVVERQVDGTAITGTGQVWHVRGTDGCLYRLAESRLTPDPGRPRPHPEVCLCPACDPTEED